MDKRVDRLIEAMSGEISRHGLNVLSRYPDDLLVHDRAVLSWAAVPGMRIAWLAGDSCTHIVPLELHDHETDLVSALLNMSSRDRFYMIKIGHDDFVISEVTREAFSQFAKLPSKYLAEGSKHGFWLKRRADKSPVGTIEVVSEGNWQNIVHKARIAPIAGISQMDEAALNVWCSHAVRNIAGTLFAKSEVTWVDPIRVAA